MEVVLNLGLCTEQGEKKILPLLWVWWLSLHLWTNKEWFCAGEGMGALALDWTAGGVGWLAWGPPALIGPDSWAGCTGMCVLQEGEQHETAHHKTPKEGRAWVNRTPGWIGLPNAEVRFPGLLPTLLNFCIMLFWSQVWVSSVYKFFWRWSPQLDIVLYPQGWIFIFYGNIFALQRCASFCLTTVNQL